MSDTLMKDREMKSCERCPAIMEADIADIWENCKRIACEKHDSWVATRYRAENTALLAKIVFEHQARLDETKSHVETAKFLEKAKFELAELQAKSNFTYCAYCGYTIPVDSDESIGDHIAVCSNHPMRVVEERLAASQYELIAAKGALQSLIKNLSPAIEYVQAHAEEHGIEWGGSITEWIGKNLPRLIEELAAKNKEQ